MRKPDVVWASHSKTILKFDVLVKRILQQLPVFGFTVYSYACVRMCTANASCF